MPSAKPKIAQIGPYEVLEELGRGAMGVVFRGFDPSIARPVAIKVIRPQHVENVQQTEEARRRFVREANAAGRLSHNNIVTIYQLGEDRGYQYLAMEFIDGTSLNKLMTPNVPMDPEIALMILRQIADGLDHAHSLGVVHRDVKPANMLIRHDRVVKIADFGIAHVVSQTLTQQGTTFGTPAYMAPEQIQGLKVDGRADQFSLAVLAYQMLSGRRPFDAANEQSLILEIMSNNPKPIHEANPALRPRVSAVLDRGMAKEAISRYPNCGEMIRALRESVVATEPEAVLTPTVTEAPRQVRNRKALWIGGGAGTFAVATVLVALFAPSFGSHPSTTAPAVAAPGPSRTPAQSSAARAATSTPSRRSVKARENQAKPEATVARTNTGQSPTSDKTAGRPQALSPDQLKAENEKEQKIAALDSKRQQLQTELIQGQRDLAALRERIKDNSPDVLAAIERVQSLRTTLNDVTNELIELKAAPPGPGPR